LIGEPEGKRPLGRPRRRWKDNIRLVREIGWKGVDWMHLAQDRVFWWVLVKSNEHSGFRKGGKYFD
jgi:hypothetical protein